MPSYILQEDGVSKILLEGGSGALLQEGPSEVDPSFIASTTVVYAPSVPEVNASFIASTSTLYAPAVGLTDDIVLTTPGTYTWICPPGVTRIYVYAYGGGGGGYDSDGPNQGFAGGGGGAYAEGTLAVTPGNTYTFIVGGAGAAASPGGNGGDTSVVGDGGSQIVAKGGQGGQTGQVPGTGGVGGQASASTGTVKHSGGAGGDGQPGPGTAGSGGGASGNQLTDGAAGSLGGGGGSSTGGAGGVGANGGGSGGQGCGYAHDNATPGTAPGGGGGGGSSGAVSTHSSAGAPGQLKITVGFVLPFIASNTVVYTPTMPIQAPFIGSLTTVYTPTLPLQVNVPFIGSTTVVYVPDLPEVRVPFISSATRVFGAWSLFDPNRTFSGPGNGGEAFVVRLAPNGVTHTATLAAGISASASALELTGDGSFPSTEPFVATIDSEVLYLVQVAPGSYRIRARGVGNTTPAAHTAGVTVSWGDSYDLALVASSDIAHNFTADINSTGSTTYTGWLICFDSTQAYLGASRYPMHVTEVLGVFDAGTGSTGSNRLDGPQPNAVATPVGVSDDCAASLSNPARIAADIAAGDVALVRFTNPEASVLDLGPRSVAFQSWFGLKRVDDTDGDVTLTDPSPPDSGGHGAHVIDTIPGTGPYTGSVNDEWFDPSAIGIGPDTGQPTPNNCPYTTVTLPGSDRYFTDGIHYSEKGWPIGVLTVRQGDRRVPFWRSYDWHNFSYVYCGFGTDDSFAQIVINRNGVSGSETSVALPGPQDIAGPDAVWDDGSYYFGVSWYVAIYGTPYLVIGPGIGSDVPPGTGAPGGMPGVAFVSGSAVITLPPTVEGGSGGDISPAILTPTLFQAAAV